MKKINYILAAVALLLGVSTAQAQSVEDNYPYNFITIQGGAQGTFTNYDFTKLITPISRAGRKRVPSMIRTSSMLLLATSTC